MRLDDFSYDLPADRIAQRAVEPRDASRLFVLERRTGARRHAHFRDLPSLLEPRDLLVLNDTRVIQARLRGRRSTGGRVECLILRDRGDGRFEALLRAGGRLRAQERIAIASGALEATLIEKDAQGTWLVILRPAERVSEVMARAGETPLPPYIRRPADESDRARYQTVFARVDGSVAAPTAGLHFTPALLARLEGRGVATLFVTLHVGAGTFRPIEVADPLEHVMEAEIYEVPEATARALAEARSAGRRVVACGTTSVRTLETFARTGERRGETSLFLHPGFEFRAVDALITNFHLPRSTLLLLVAAFAGRDLILDAYREAIAAGYRFYSYGDAMLIL